MPKGDYSRMRVNLRMYRPMIRLILFALLTSPSFSSGAQEFIGKSKTSLINKFNKKDHNDLAVSVKDSLLILTYSKGDNGNFQKILSFDEAGNCKAEKYVNSSLENYSAALESIISEKKFEWKKLNENQYVSRYKDQLMIELPVKKDDYSFTVFHAGWTPELYKMLTGN